MPCSTPALPMLLVGILTASPAAANGDRLYIDCPCEIESDVLTMRMTAGVRSFRSTDSGALSLRAEVRQSSRHVAEVSVTDALASGATLQTATYRVSFPNPARLSGAFRLDFVLYEQVNDGSVERDRVRMEVPVNPTGAFRVGDLDYLKDADGDGVGDANERFEGTDPLDEQSTPGPSTIDLLAAYTDGFSRLFDGDRTTRIQHVVALANEIYANSEVRMTFRLVGIVNASAVGSFDYDEEADRHGADVVARFNDYIGIACGSAGLGGLRTRGHLDFHRESTNVANVYGSCGARTLAHELGHVLGLGHSLWQANNSPTGTWRWSRGHAFDHDFGTVMTYGPRTGGGLWLEVFSDPSARCTGALEDEKPCGIDGGEVNGADAVTSLNAVRFQFAAFRALQPDADEDGFVDPVDLFPDDPAEWWDADSDGMGDNADSDGDGVGDNAGEVLSRAGAGDAASFLIGVPLHDGGGLENAGAAYLVFASDLATQDAADGHLDRVIGLGDVASGANSWKFLGEHSGDQAGRSLVSSGDMDGDGQTDLLIGAPYHGIQKGAVYFVSGADLSAADAADGVSDRTIHLAQARRLPRRYRHRTG